MPALPGNRKAPTERILALDTEATGLDLYHGAKPFFVTTYELLGFANEDGDTVWEGKWQNWEWDVDPLTREPIIPEADKNAIRLLLSFGHTLVLQNAPFDVKALERVGIVKNWPWNRTYDTLQGAHLLASNAKKDLTSLSTEYLGENIQSVEDELEAAVKQARNYCRHHLPDWKIAKEGLEGMPSAKKGGSGSKEDEEKMWKFDSWLPRALAKHLGESEDHPWYHVLHNYAVKDSETTAGLWVVIRELIKKRGLWEIFEARRPLPRIAVKMSNYGVSGAVARREELKQEYMVTSYEAAQKCINIADRYDWELQMPKGASPNENLREFMLEVLRLPPQYSKKSKTNAPTLDKDAMLHYSLTLEPGTMAASFVRALMKKRKRDSALAYLRAYERYAIAMDNPEWFRIHFSINPYGTDTLRWACRNPNGQNISKQEMQCEACQGEGKGCKFCQGTGVDSVSLRYLFGPAPGREWYLLDFKNVERRLPAYEAKEEAIIALFEQPDEPPYFGSEHLLVAHVLHPKEFEACRDGKGNLDGRIFKALYKDTLYQWTKNGNFAIQYQAGDRTADATYKVPGARRRLKERFAKQDALNEQQVRMARKLGYVETIPDRKVNPEHGYPLRIRSENGNVKPTLPLAYHVSGSAMWEMGQAMVKCDGQLEEWNRQKPEYFMALQVHDELIFDFPLAAHPRKDPAKSNLGRAKELRRLMESCGIDHLGIPTPVSISYTASSWDDADELE